MLLYQFTRYCHPFGDLAKLIRNQRLVMRLAIMDTPEKSLKPFYLNCQKVNLSHNGLNGQTLRHLQHVHFPVHDNKILERVKALVINQPFARDTFRDAVHFQNIVDFL